METAQTRSGATLSSQLCPSPLWHRFGKQTGHWRPLESRDCVLLITSTPFPLHGLGHASHIRGATPSLSEISHLQMRTYKPPQDGHNPSVE